MAQTILWWFLASLLGWAAFPLSFWLFPRLADRGYTFSRALGLLFVSYVLWLGASLHLLPNDPGGIAVALLALVGLSAWLALRPGGSLAALRAFLRTHGRLILTGELLFALCLFAWAALRAYTVGKIMPTGGEKFMEMAFLNGILHSRQFPPLDPWLSGYAISYYYFGYVMMALLTQLSGAASTVAFELYDALLFALTALGAFGLVYNLAAASQSQRSRAIPAGLLGALLVGGVGNLQGLLEALYSRGWLPAQLAEWLAVPGFPAQAQVSGSFYPGSFWGWGWRASRVINDLDLTGQAMLFQPITEFPNFSFLLGDNHPHLLALPFALLAAGVALHLLLSAHAGDPLPRGFLMFDPTPVPPVEGAGGKSFVGLGGLFGPPNPTPQPEKDGVREGQAFLRKPCPLPRLRIAAFAWISGSLIFLNTWDFPIYLGLALLAWLVGRAAAAGRISRGSIWQTARLGIEMALWGGFFYALFLLGFSSQAGGVLPYIFPPTRLAQYLVMFGPLIVLLAGFLLVSFGRQNRATGEPFSGRALFSAWLRLAAALALLFLALLLLTGLVLWVDGLRGGSLMSTLLPYLGSDRFLIVAGAALAQRLTHPWLFLLLTGLLFLAAAGIYRTIHSTARPDLPSAQPAADSTDPGLLFARLLALVGLALTFSVEFFYLRDGFGVRMNTVFKFYFQGWVLMACAAAYGLWWLAGQAASRGAARLLRAIYLCASLLLILAGLVYSVVGAYSRTDGFSGTPHLDGASELRRDNPDDWAAIDWLASQAQTGAAAPILLEAPGTSYTYAGRISAFTGFPALLGWATHELQWRGSYDEQARREALIAQIYTTADEATALRLLREAGVAYVILGAPERAYIQARCALPERSCNPARAEEKFERSLQLVFQQGQTAVYAVPPSQTNGNGR